MLDPSHAYKIPHFSKNKSKCWNVSHVTWSRDHEARLTNLTLEQPPTSRQQLTTNFNTAYVSQYSNIRARW